MIECEKDIDENTKKMNGVKKREDLLKDPFTRHVRSTNISLVLENPTLMLSTTMEDKDDDSTVSPLGKMQHL
uniref:Uncharacterized protein n=1 Tax=Vespula pensylvanica TaxID=30213 RepID=A0A834UB59_VESPE|nr:hypothetical protein H0235_006972 [Vespula pensylvanica]